MKKILSFLVFAFSLPVLTVSCTTPPSARVVQVQTLKAVGESAEAAVTLSAQLYQAGQITPAQARTVIDFYDLKFQPAYRIAVSAVNANLDSFASPDLVSLSTQLALLVQSYQKKP